MKWRGPMGGGSASGKVGALVASRSRSTQYLRSRTTPVNPRTVFQGVIRNALKYVSQLWSTLTEAQIGGWENYASNVTRTNVLGDATNISPVNWFVGNNVVRQQAGLSLVLTGPSTFNLGNPAFEGVTFDCGGTNPSTTAIIGLGTTSLPIDAGTDSYMLLYVSRPYAAGRAAPVGSNQLMGMIPANTTGTSFTFTSPFPRSDTNSQMQLTIRVSREDGRLSSPFTFPCG